MCLSRHDLSSKDQIHTKKRNPLAPIRKIFFFHTKMPQYNCRVQTGAQSSDASKKNYVDPISGSWLVHRLRCWPAVKQTLSERIMFGEMPANTTHLPKCWPTVYDAGTSLVRHWVDVSLPAPDCEHGDLSLHRYGKSQLIDQMWNIWQNLGLFFTLHFCAIYLMLVAICLSCHFEACDGGV